MIKESLADIESRMNIYNLCYWFINMGGVVAGNINRKVETIARPRPDYPVPGERVGITVKS